MQLTIEQLSAAEQGDAVRIEADGKTFVLLSQRIYDDSLDYSPWTAKEVDLLADEALELVSGDGLDELDEERIGRLSTELQTKLDNCLKAALGLS